ncbi:MAG: LamG-like jellyroll fold domain-containing protein [Candidatus Shapirobacteria bacterium]|jgi:hypothetical protein
MSFHKRASSFSYKTLLIILVFLLIPIVLLIRINQKRASIKAASWPVTAGEWLKRKQLTLANNSGQTLDANTTYSLTLNTKALVDSGDLQSDCADLRVYYQSLTTNAQLNYYVDLPSSATCATSASTIIHFPLQADMANSAVDPNYFLYYSNPNAVDASSISAFNIGSKQATFYCGFNGNTTCATASGTTTPTTSSGAIRYSGANSALSFGSGDNVSKTGTLLSGSNFFTVEFWFKAADNPISSQIMSLTNGGGDGGSGVFHYWGDGRHDIQAYTFNGCKDYSASSANITHNLWYHIAIVRNGADIKYYLNGNNYATGTGLCTTPTIWSGFNIGSNNYNGIVDEVRVSSVARYTTDFTPQTTPFVRDEFTKLLLHFDENGDDPRNSGKAIDDSGNANHGTITGAKYVGGLVGIDSSTLDTGTLPTQSYAAHPGIFLEEATTNKITNPSFEHGTYSIGWTDGGNDFSTFTPNIAKRNAGTGATAPFAAGVLIQGDRWGDANGDSLAFPLGSQIAGNLYNQFDRKQGSITFWYTPEFNSDDDTSVHGLFAFSSDWNGIELVYDSRVGYKYFSLGVDEKYATKSQTLVAGATYLITARWSSDYNLDGTNYLSISVGDSHSYGGTSAPTIDATNSNIYIGKGISGGIGVADGIIEGLTIYRRPLWDGAYGINAGNGDEIALIHGSGIGKDPATITGSWDVVFALPTNSSTGTLGLGTTATGEAWSHPHASNVLYTSTTNTGGFMMSGTAPNDGWNVIPWYKVGGTTGQVAAYQAIGAGSSAASYVNLANPGTYNLTSGTAPTWSASTGWTFNGTNQFLTTGLTPSANTWSYLVRFSDANTSDYWRAIIGTTDNNNWSVAVYPIAGGGGYKAYYNGHYDSLYLSGAVASGVMGMSYNKGYLNGTSEPGTIPIINPPNKNLYIGAKNTNSGADSFLPGKIQAAAIYNTTLTADQVANVTDAMETLDAGGTYLSVAPLAASEKIYAGGYKFTTTGANQGISTTKTGLTAGQNYVVRAIANSGDGTGQPKIFIYDETNGADITSYTGTVGSGRTAPDVMLFTFELPTIAKHGVSADCTSITVKLVNAANSGTVHWHQVELLPNQVNGPSMETGSGTPWLPTGFTITSGTEGEAEQELSDVNSGLSAWQINGMSTYGKNGTYDLDTTFSTGSFINVGFAAKGASDANFGFHECPDPYRNMVATSTGGSTWKNFFNAVRMPTLCGEGSYLSFYSWTVGIVDDLYAFRLSDVSLTVTPATSTNSLESNRIRIDGTDTYTHTLLGTGTTIGSVVFDYTPRHSASIINKFGSTMPYIAEFYGDSDDYIRLYWSAANTIKLDYSMVGSTASATWDASAVTAGTTYQMSIGYTGGGTMSFILDGTSRISLSSIPANFGTAPSTAFWGTNQTGLNQADATFLPQPASFIQNTISPYFKFGAKSTTINNSLASDPRGFVIPINTGSTATHTLSAYVYDGTTGNMGGAVSSTVAQLIFNGVAVGTTYVDAGGGWWRLWYRGTAGSDSQNYGLQVKSGKTIYVDGFQLEQNQTLTTYTDGNMGIGYSWTGTANESTSTRAIAQTIYNTAIPTNDTTGTVSLWVKPNWNGSDGPAEQWDTLTYLKIGSGGYGWGNGFFIGNYSNNPGDTISSFRVGHYGTGSGTATVSTTITKDKWYHLVYTWNETTAQLFVNNVASSAITFNTHTDDGRVDFIPTSYGSPHSTTISNAKFYDDPLTAAEVADLYYSGLGSHQQQSGYTERFTDGEPSTSYWKLDENTGTILNDSININHGALGSGSSSPTWAIGTSCAVNSCLSFDGSDDYAIVNGSLTGLKSLSFWIKPSASSTPIFDLNGIQTVTLTNNILQANGLTSPSIYVNGAATSAVPSDIWSQVLITSSTSFGLSSLKIGQSGADFFSGFLDEIKVFPYVLSSSEIKKETNLGKAVVIGEEPGQPVVTPISKKLVAHWKFDEGYNTIAHDSVGTNNGTFGTGSSAPNWSNDGKFGKALSFDGNDYVTLSTGAEFDLTSVNPSISLWFKTTASSGTLYGDYAANNTLNGFLTISGGKASGSFRDGGTFILSVGGTKIVNDDNWHYVALVKTSDTTLSLYIDGKLDATGSNSSYNNSNLIGGVLPSLGRNPEYNNDFYTGLLDEVKIYNHALTGDEIKQDYNLGSAVVFGTLSSGTGNTAPSSAASQEYCIPGDSAACLPPVGRWDFNEGVGNSTYDTSGNNNTGEIVNASWLSGRIGKSLRFNGVNNYIKNIRIPIRTSGNQVHTIALWFKTSAASSGPLIQFGDANLPATSANADEAIGWRSANGVLSVSNYCNNSSHLYTNSQASYRDNKWHFLTYVVDGTSSKLFVDGILRGQNTSVTSSNIQTYASNPYMGIGLRTRPSGSDIDNDDFADAIIDQILVYNYARSPAQIALDYNHGRPIAHYKMDECQGTAVHNSSSDTFHGTLSVGASGTQTSAGTCTTSGVWFNGATGKINSSLNLDGSDDYVSVGDIGTSATAVSFWIKPSSTSQSILELSASDSIAISSGTITVTGFGTETVYVDGRLSSTIPDTNWHHITVVSSASLPANTVNLGKVGSTYYSGLIDDVQIYNYPLTPTQIKTIFNSNAAIKFSD